MITGTVKPIKSYSEAITRAIVWSSGTRDAAIVSRMQSSFVALARLDGVSDEEIDAAVRRAYTQIAAEGVAR
jgi:hypothetical protein